MDKDGSKTRTEPRKQIRVALSVCESVGVFVGRSHRSIRINIDGIATNIGRVGFLSIYYCSITFSLLVVAFFSSIISLGVWDEKASPTSAIILYIRRKTRMRIVKYPHPMLAYASKPLLKIDQTIRDIVSEMFDLMYSTSGVGLAANQVDLPYRLIVVNPTADPEQKDQEYVFINPTILKLKGKTEEDEEGCLSFPDLRLIVPRAREVKFQAVDLQGQLHTYFWEGFNARIIQHETDHLAGVCFYQRATASATRNFELYMQNLREQFELDRQNGLEPTMEQFQENVAKWESERS